MAAQGKKKQKMKGTKVSLNDFLGDEHNVVAAKPLDWAAEMDSVDADYEADTKSIIDRSKLPTAPKAARGPDVDMNRIPSNPPFTAFIGNLPYEASEDSIAGFFKKLNVVNVRLPHDKGRLRGFGYVEFEDRQSLIDALAMTDEIFSGRKIRVDLAGQNQQQNDHGGDDRNRGDPSRSDGDWRSRDITQDPDYNRMYNRGQSDGYGSRDGRGYDDRGPRDGYGSRDGRGYDDRGPRGGGFDDRRGGGFDRGGRDDYNRDRGYGDRYDRSGYDRRDRYDDRGPMRDRGYNDRGPSRGYDNDRDRGYDDRGPQRGGGYDSYDRGPRRDYGGRDRYSDRRRDRYDDDRGERRGFGSGFRREDQDGGYREDRSDRQGSRESSREAPKERPKLQLQPRSKPKEAEGSDNRSEKSSIFGSAKPVDTAAREREIEERLQRERQEERRHLEEEKENRNTYNNSQSYRPRRDSDRSQDGSGSTARQRRLSSGSSGKGTRSAPPPISPNRSRRESEVSNHSEVFSGNEEAPEEPKSPVSPSTKEEPPTRLVPAPPPAVNVWEKRKSESKSAQPTSPSPSSQSTTASVSPPQSSQSKSASSPQTSPSSANAWSKDKRTEGPVEAPRENRANRPADTPRENAWFKNQPDSQPKIEGGRGRFPGDRGESSDRGRGGGRGGRGRGAPKPRNTREKQVPKSIEDMPKYESTPQKDWSDSNKFAGLLDDDDKGDEES